jgi:hypothetical protein
MLIDAKLVPARSYYLVFFSLVAAIVQGLIFLRVFDTEVSVVVLLSMQSLTTPFLDATVDCYMVE